MNIYMGADDAEALRTAYLKALDEGHDTFEFEGHVLLTRYARFLLMFLFEQGLLKRNVI